MTRFKGQPKAEKRPVSEVLHGVEITDPYRWLEEVENEEAARWAQAQGEYTEEVLAESGVREALRKRLAQLMSTSEVGSPAVRGDRVFYLRRGRDQDQPVLHVREEDGSERVLLNPNVVDEEGITSLDWWHPSPDGNYVVYGYSRGGDEWSTLYVVDVDSGERMSEEVARARHSSVAWQKDESGFYYTRYPHEGEVPEGEENYHSRVFYHRLNTDTEDDPLVFGEGRPMKEMYNVKISDDGEYLLLTAAEGWNRNDVFVRREGDEPTADFTPSHADLPAYAFHGQIVEGRLYLLTNWQAGRYRLLAVDLKRPEESEWEEIIGEREDLTLRNFRVVDGHLVLTGLTDACSRLYLYDLDGTRRAEVDLPGEGTVGQLDGQPAGGKAFFTFESFTRPTSIFTLDPREGQVEEFVAGEQPVQPDEFTAKQVFYRSRDGTRVPMFILHKKGISLEEPRPTVLTGYGGFNISRTPRFSPSIYPWLENGGIWALANLRGGSEYGEQWHRDGMRENKQNVFDDFIAAGEFLVDEGYTDTERLGISGRSNGGLLVGAAMTQRPDLFGAVACGVPLLDMLRYHKFLIGALWTTEYGSPDEEEQFRWLHEYSPYHNVREGEEYPAVLFFTATSDTRVHPSHAYKMTALLQEASASEEPVLLRVETKAGHGAGKPVHKRVAEQADVWSFLAWQLGLEIGENC